MMSTLPAIATMSRSIPSEPTAGPDPNQSPKKSRPEAAAVTLKARVPRSPRMLSTRNVTELAFQCWVSVDFVAMVILSTTRTGRMGP